MTSDDKLAPRQAGSCQLSLFPCTREQFVAKMFVSADESKSCRDKCWLSFDPHDKIEYHDGERLEVEFIKGLARSRLSDAMIDRILSGLNAPYCYDPSPIFFSFVMNRCISLPLEPDLSDVTDDYIEALIQAKELDALRRLHRTISDAMQESEAVNE